MASLRDTLATLFAKESPSAIQGTPLGKAYPDLAQPEPGLEAPFLSPDDLIGTGIGKATLAGGAKLAPLLMGMVKNPSMEKTVIYHGTSPEAANMINKHGFDVNKSADNSIWFTTDPNIGEVAATGKGGIVKALLDENKIKLGGWDEADKYFTDELISQGYKGLKFPGSAGEHTHYRIFDTEILKDLLKNK